MTKKISQLLAAAALTGSEQLEVSQLSATIKITATTISAAAADNSFNDSANGFVTAGFAAGDQVKVEGFTGNLANNLFSAQVTALTAGKMTIGGSEGDVIVNDAAGESVTITKWVSRRAASSALGGAASGAASFNSATAFDAFGDSITDGTGASAPANEYVARIASSRGWTAVNHGVSGDMVADHADDVFALTVLDGHQSTLMLGTNDQRTYQGNTFRQGAFKMGHAALVAWLAIPHTRKQLGQAPTAQSGTWTDTTVYGGAIGRQSVVPASTITFTVYGTVAYISTILQNGITATFSVTVDGVVRGVYSCAPGATITSVNGRTYMPALIRIPGLSEGAHTLVLTVITASAGNPVYALWASGNQGHRTKTGPNLWVGNVPRFTAAGYTASGGSDAVVAIFNDAVRQNVETLAGDGLNVALVDSAARLNPLVDLDTDGVHPDDGGHLVIAEAFLEAINQIQKPRTMNRQPPPRRSVNLQTGTAYKLVMADHDKLIRMGNAGAQTLTVPTHTEVPFELGTIIPVTATAAADLVVAADAGVTINAPNGLVLGEQYSRGELIKIEPLVWDFHYTPAGSAGAPVQCLAIACSDESTALTAGTGKVTFRMPYAFTLSALRASVTTAPTGSVLTVDINEGGVSILSTKLTIDPTEKTSQTAAAPAVISDASLADDAEITIDIDAVGSTVAGAGLKVLLIGTKA